MAASNEWEDMHLTPAGWVRGTALYDFDRKEPKPIPTDAVLTVRRHVHLPAYGEKIQVEETRSELSRDAALVKSLLERYGEPTFGV